MQGMRDTEQPENRKAIQQRKRKKARLYRRISFAATCIAILLFLICIALFLMQSSELQMQDELSNMYHGSARIKPSFSLISSACAEELVSEQEVPERFAELFNINSDLIGWIRVGDAADGPVVYRDNEYYMDHNFYLKNSSSGTIFADVENENWASDSFVILYGHNMRNGSMFGKLGQYRKISYAKENPIITFDTILQETENVYVPFSVFDASMVEDHENFFHLRRFDLFRSGETDEIKEYLDELIDRSLYMLPVDVTTEDQILALVTCSYNDPNGRLMVFCRKLRENETAETVRAVFQGI